MKLEAHQRDAVIAALSGPYGRAELRCDGYKVQALVQPVSQRSLSFEVVVYVNGRLEGNMLLMENSLGGKFYPTRKRSMYSTAKRMQIERQCGKRAARRYFKLDAVVEYRWPAFRSGRAFLAHLEKHNELIELIEPNVGGRK